VTALQLTKIERIKKRKDKLDASDKLYSLILTSIKQPKAKKVSGSLSFTQNLTTDLDF